MIGPGSACDIVAPVPEVDLVTVGEAFEDLVFSGLRRLPRPGEEIKTSEFMKTIGGGAVITAVAASRLGLRTRVLSGLGEEAVARLRREKVGVTNLKRPTEPHAITAALSTPGNRSFVTFNGVNDVLEPRLFPALRRERAGHVHFAFYPRDCGRWTDVVEGCRARSVTTSWDFGWNEGLLRDRGFPSLVGALDYVFLNEQETLLYARRRTMSEAVSVWRAQTRCIVLKLGSRGSRWVSARVEVSKAAPRVRARDTTGAGDAFNGGFLFGLLRGLPPRACLEAGNFAGAMSTRAAGGVDALPHRRELPAAIRGRRAIRARGVR